jgi:hypothetical protein
MLNRLREFYGAHLRIFSACAVAIIIALWLAGPVLFNFLSQAQSFLSSFVIITAMLAVIQEYLNDSARPNVNFLVSATQSEQNHQIYELLRGERLHNVRMIEYDSESTKPLVTFFLERGASVHCLIQHPDSAVNDRQRQRTVLQIITCEEEYHGHLERIKFSYYRPVASLRARYVEGSLLSLGWYTYDCRNQGRARQVWGHNNPNVLFDLRRHVPPSLVQFFDQVFSNLLADSAPWEEVYAKYATGNPKPEGTVRKR